MQDGTRAEQMRGRVYRRAVPSGVPSRYKPPRAGCVLYVVGPSQLAGVRGSGRKAPRPLAKTVEDESGDDDVGGQAEETVGARAEFQPVVHKTLAFPVRTPVRRNPPCLYRTARLR